jgi:hypothetical protein
LAGGCGYNNNLALNSAIRIIDGVTTVALLGAVALGSFHMSRFSDGMMLHSCLPLSLRFKRHLLNPCMAILRICCFYLIGARKTFGWIVFISPLLLSHMIRAILADFRISSYCAVFQWNSQRLYERVQCEKD